MALNAIEIKDKIRTYIVNNFMILGNSELADEDSFMEKGIIDSTGILEVVGFLQSDFGISVADEEMLPDNLDSIARLSTFVQKKVSN